MKLFKKLTAAFLAVLIAVVCVPIADIGDMGDIFAIEASAKSKGSLGGNVSWSYKSKTLTISGSGNMSNYSDTPSDFTKYQADLVVKINNQTENVVINEGVTSIGNNVFKNFIKLKTVTIANSVTSIGDYAFKGCTALTSVTIGSKTASIGIGAFSGCTKLSAITIPASVKTLGASAFEGCSALASVKLNSGLTSIGNNCFKNTKAASVSIPDSVTSIGTDAFKGISGVALTCSYGSTAYNYAKKNSIKYLFSSGNTILLIEPKLVAASKQLEVTLKLLCDSRNKAAINAANFTLTYNTAALTPVSTATVYPDANSTVMTTTVYGSGKVSFAVTAQDAASYTTSGSETYYTIAKLSFKINGQSDAASLKLTADALMLNGTVRKDVAATDISYGLHVSSGTPTVTKKATCTSTGSRYYTCQICGKKTTESIPVDTSNHAGDTEIKNAIKETCYSAGYTGDTYCKGCNTIIKKGSDVEATDKHNTEIRNKKDATCTETGYSGDEYCVDCGNLITEGKELALTAHSYDILEEKKATCSSDGKITYVCAQCGASYVDYIPARSHVFGEWTVTSEPTYMNTGIETRYCEKCNSAEEREIEQLVATKEFVDDASGISVFCVDDTYTEEITVKVDVVYDGASFEVINKEIGNFSAQIFDITTYVADEKVQPNGTVLVKIPIPEGFNAEKLEIYYISDDGVAVEKLNSYIEDGNFICFEAEHFSQYAVVDASEELPQYILGDVNSDGNVNAADARLALRISAELDTPTDIQNKAADVDLNGTVNASDARLILRYSAGLEQF